MSNEFNKILIDALDYYDCIQYQNYDIIEKINNKKYNMEMYRNQNVIVLDNGARYICEAIGCFDVKLNLWVWAWAFPSSQYDTNRIIKLLNYGINISFTNSNVQNIINKQPFNNDPMLYLRGLLITSRITLKYTTGIDLMLALASYICKMNKIVCIKSSSKDYLVYVNLIDVTD